MKKIGILGAASAILAVVIVVSIARANPEYQTHYITPPPDKQTLEARERITSATNAVVAVHITKYPDIGPTDTEAVSCPQAAPEKIGVIPFSPGPFGDGGELNSEAVALSAAGNISYWIWAGAPEDNPDQGMIRVIASLLDPCASHKLGLASPSGLADYFLPKGPLTILRIEGDLLVYSIASGGSGIFNLDTHQFLPLPVGKRTIDSSCPWTPKGANGIYMFRGAGPDFGENNFTNVAYTVASTENIYQIWAGAPVDQPHQGMIRVKELLADPCAASLAGHEASPTTDYRTPKGPLTFTKLEGDTILYSIAGGGSGSFNFVTGTFLP